MIEQVQILEEYKNGWKAGFDFAYKKVKNIVLGFDKNGKYNNTAQYEAPDFPADVYKKGALYGDGFAEGMISGRSRAAGGGVNQFEKR